jgi:hypothetical protein
MEYFVHELRNKGQDVAIFIDANQNYSRCYSPQVHTDNFESKARFNIDGRIYGSLKPSLKIPDCTMHFTTNKDQKKSPPTREPDSKVIDYVFVS